MSLSWLAILLGVGYAVPQVCGLLKPEAYREGLRRFPRSEGWGYVLMLSATAWFLWNLHREDISDFAAAKPFLMAGFGAVGVGACFYLKDFLAVRGLAVLFLLLAKLILDTARPVDTDWRILMSSWAYLLVLLGMWFTVSPYRLRDWIGFITASDSRLRFGSVARLAFCGCLLCLGLTVFRG